MSDTSVLATEEHELRPLSLYAETKVAVERPLLGPACVTDGGTVLRFATLFGVSPRMRFDLTVNQFVMEMLVHRRLVVYRRALLAALRARPRCGARDRRRADRAAADWSPARCSTWGAQTRTIARSIWSR